MRTYADTHSSHHLLLQGNFRTKKRMRSPESPNSRGGINTWARSPVDLLLGILGSLGLGHLIGAALLLRLGFLLVIPEQVVIVVVVHLGGGCRLREEQREDG